MVHHGPSWIEAEPEPSEEESETVDTPEEPTDVNAGEKVTDEDQKEMEDRRLTKTVTKAKGDNRRQTRTKNKVRGFQTLGGNGEYSWYSHFRVATFSRVFLLQNW